MGIYQGNNIIWVNCEYVCVQSLHQIRISRIEFNPLEVSTCGACSTDGLADVSRCLAMVASHLASSKSTKLTQLAKLEKGEHCE